MPRYIDPIGPPPPTPLLANPLCQMCSHLMRLNRVTPHDTKEHVEIRTYECRCGHEMQQTVPLQ